jgi:hypothetical protein
VEYTNVSVMASWSALSDHCSLSWEGVECVNGRVNTLYVSLRSLSTPSPTLAQQQQHKSRQTMHHDTILS